tara:strand:- start:4608 stop:5075 length:468 start_codon:yes stop_codon:yes gene_type:complete
MKNSINKSMTNKILFLALTIVVISTGWGQKQLDLKEKLIQQYLGEWVNTNTNSANITRLIIKNSGTISVEAFGSCAPKDCEIGVTELHLISDSVDNDSNVTPFNYAIAIWDLHYVKQIMKLKVQNTQLLIENTSIFKDNSGRNNYSFSAIMKKNN